MNTCKDWTSYLLVSITRGAISQLKLGNKIIYETKYLRIKISILIINI